MEFSAHEDFPGIVDGFRRMQGFPGVVGAIDCTHIEILNPGGPDVELFRNWKHWFSINVQMFCDDKLLIRDIVASH